MARRLRRDVLEPARPSASRPTAARATTRSTAARPATTSRAARATTSIHGGRGVDHIYGDSGFNVNMLHARAHGRGRQRTARARRSTRASIAGDQTLAPVRVAERRRPAGGRPRHDLRRGRRDRRRRAAERLRRRHLRRPRPRDPADVADPNAPDTRLQKIQTTTLASIRRIESRAFQNGGDDVIFGNLGRDMIVAGTGHDMADGDEADDLGLRRQRVPRAARRRGARRRHPADEHDGPAGHDDPPLPGALRDAALQPHRPARTRAAGRSPADNSGELLVNGVAHAWRDPDSHLVDGAPWWAEYLVVFDDDPATPTRSTRSRSTAATSARAASATTTSPAARRTTCCSASSATTSSRATAASRRVRRALARRRLAHARRLPATRAARRATSSATSTSSRRSRRATDGEDYIEGNGGDDIVFGGLGQDDIVGGSSSFFSLTTHDQRPGRHGPHLRRRGHERARNDLGDAVLGTAAGGLTDVVIPDADGHARDADTIVGDNGDIIRLVGLNGGDRRPGHEVPDVQLRQLRPGQARRPRRDAARLHAGRPGLPARRCTSARRTSACSALRGDGSTPLRLPRPRRVHRHRRRRRGPRRGRRRHRLHRLRQRRRLRRRPGRRHRRLAGATTGSTGGTGQDGILGDDGRIFTSRNSACAPASSAVCTAYSEPLYGVHAFRASDPDTKITHGDVLEREHLHAGPGAAGDDQHGRRSSPRAVDMTPFNLAAQRARHADRPAAFDANNSDDVIFGGLGRRLPARRRPATTRSSAPRR